MQVSFLLDENIAAPLADKLDKAGHDVERVVDVSELGEGVDDTTIRRYAVQAGRLIVTSDDDFVQMPADVHSGVFYRRSRASASGLDPEGEARQRFNLPRLVLWINGRDGQ
ncbi:DUF5615 family PIN-like protein [Haloarcula nitratireducens]|uniref:DUF5615 family PIN-like protein n=1 Tax=Haloarcula nitratireducens TaxID=2487749 RepID=A0AAW4PGZ6_9EURY|nr:DUF5615 family PIN-like protein [Halomicroarcula nitratireducens]MBX0296710.1 DUF5615 family PIN-like protein [Halomicroarcula nitratireducens]